MSNMQYSKPFDMRFVFKVTVRHMRKCIDNSLEKTFNRIKEFEGNVEKSTEIFKTLAMLHSMRNQLDSIVDRTGEDNGTQRSGQ
jgi:hypothetical protein